MGDVARFRRPCGAPTEGIEARAGNRSSTRRKTMSGPELDRATMRWYGVGQAAEGIKNYSFAVFLLFYFNQVLGLSGTLCGVALAVALAFDAITDPLAGTLSDRLDSRWGRRHPFMYAAAVPLGLFFALLFTPPAALGQW